MEYVSETLRVLYRGVLAECRQSLFFFFKQKTAYDMLRSLVGAEMCIRDRGYSERLSPAHLSWIDVCFQQVFSARTLSQMAEKLSLIHI